MKTSRRRRLERSPTKIMLHNGWIATDWTLSVKLADAMQKPSFASHTCTVCSSLAMTNAAPVFLACKATTLLAWTPLCSACTDSDTCRLYRNDDAQCGSTSCLVPHCNHVMVLRRTVIAMSAESIRAVVQAGLRARVLTWRLVVPCLAKQHVWCCPSRARRSDQLAERQLPTLALCIPPGLSSCQVRPSAQSCITCV
jgi:hypothetical protein